VSLHEAYLGDMYRLVVALLLLTTSVLSQGAGDYYAGIDSSLTNDALKGELQALISPHTVLSYDDVWAAFDIVDRTMNGYPCNPNNATYIPDVYSNHCWAPSPSVEGGECGNYKKEGDCFNREHIWPKSWFGGFDAGQNAQTDLWELYPSDGYVNGLRGAYRAICVFDLASFPPYFLLFVARTHAPTPSFSYREPPSGAHNLRGGCHLHFFQWQQDRPLRPRRHGRQRLLRKLLRAYG